MKPGIYDRVPSNDYHADEGFGDTPTLSSSIAKILINKSPAHARSAHPKLNPNFERDDDNKIFAIGTVAHQMLLEGSDDCLAVYHGLDWRKNDAKEFREQALAEGKVPLLLEQAGRARDMVAAAREQISLYYPTYAFFAGGKPEQTIVWEDQHDVVCRARIDWLHDETYAIDDYKTTSASSEPDRWGSKTMYSIGGDIQVAFYMRGVKALTGVTPPFRFIVQETYEPYALSVVDLAPSALALANDKVEKAINVWATCLQKDFWPAYPTRVASVEVPTWEEMRWLDREDVAA